ncbi:tetratricopeptide repeat protein [Lysobacter sp. KIS68-7]|uniref:tetratricopeptide repeat protein n=1 Tax=Lysobacter sp. KIS68-7 TaxID=2904252 RepID=UPI001E53FE71|nr:tetratricopeptide repeat protein [Lysobacter sp. KIS68-7]UHQ18252.1 tetratricopeptide repeat protein [Lysobacter sp. KIS68-7]
MRDWSASLRRFIAEFRRRRVVRVAIAYLIFSWLLVQIADATFEPMGLPPWSSRLLIVLLAIGFLLACVLSWIYDIQPSGIERTLPLPDDPAPPEAAPPVKILDASVAILPFADLSEAHDQDYFCDGLAEEILNALAKVRGLHVASRTASFRFRGGGMAPSEIGRQLNVAAIMEGSVRKVGDRVRVTAQLVDASNGFHLWSDNFDRKLADIFGIQEEIASNVVNAVRPALLQSGPAFDLRKNAPRDMRAYEYYLRGRQFGVRITAESQKQAPVMFRHAIEIDPEYAQAWAGLADSLCELMLWRMVHRDVALDEARAAAQRALELDPGLAEAHVAMGHALMIGGDIEGATASFEHAIKLDPELYVAYYYYARLCYTQGRYSRAVDLFEAAHRAKPDEFQALSLAVGAADAAGDEQRKKRIAIEGLACASHQAQIDPENARAHYMTASLMQHLGVGDRGQSQMDYALRIRPDDFDVLYNGACFYALEGRTDEALDLLGRAIDSGQGALEWIEHDSDFRSLQGHPKFEQIKARLRQKR